MSRLNRAIFESVEPRRLLATHVVNGTAGDDTIWIHYEPHLERVIIIVNGADQLIDERQFDAFAIHALGGNDTINVHQTTRKPMLIDGGDGNDHFATYEWDGDLSGLRASFTVDGGSGNNDWRLVEQEHGPGRTYRLAADTFGAEGQFSCTYRNLGAISLQTSRYADELHIDGMRAGTTYTIGLGNGAGLGGIPGDRIVVGALGGLANLQGNLTIDGQGWHDTLDVRNSSNTGAGRYTVTATSLAHTLGLPAINLGGIQTIELTAGSGDDIIDIESLAPQTFLHVHGGAGDDAVRLAPTSRR
jgi:hypothetical protein